MFHFSANNLYLIKNIEYDKANVLTFKDHYTNRTYKLDVLKQMKIEDQIGHPPGAGKVWLSLGD